MKVAVSGQVACKNVAYILTFSTFDVIYSETRWHFCYSLPWRYPEISMV